MPNDSFAIDLAVIRDAEAKTLYKLRRQDFRIAQELKLVDNQDNVIIDCSRAYKGHGVGGLFYPTFKIIDLDRQEGLKDIEAAAVLKIRPSSGLGFFKISTYNNIHLYFGDKVFDVQQNTTDSYIKILSQDQLLAQIERKAKTYQRVQKESTNIA